MRIINKQNGDTIVEVLIAIVILSLILSGAYVTSNNSLKNIVDAQDRIQGLGIAQSQAENLRAQAVTDLDLTTGADKNYASVGFGTFCFDETTNQFVANVSSGDCNFDGGKYKVQISSQGSHSEPNVIQFDINVSWSSVSSNQTTDYIDIYYRVGV